MKNKLIKGVRGSISVILVIILTPMLTLAAVIVDTARLNMARSMVSSAGDLAMNSALADYDTILKDVYGLFAMSQDQDNETWAANVQKYFEDTLTGYGVVSDEEAPDYVKNLIGDFKDLFDGAEAGKNNASNFLKMDFDPSFTIEKAPNSSLAEPGVMRKQIVDYMKYRAPINVGMSFFDSLGSFTSVEAQEEVIQAQTTAQQLSQPVAKDGNTTIQAIRKFDSDFTIMMYENGLAPTEEAVQIKGQELANDSTPITPIEYEDQLKKYEIEIGSNTPATPQSYKRLNRIVLAFLFKAPKMDNHYYLYNKNTGLINSSFDVDYSNKGIITSPTLSNETATAKHDYEEVQYVLMNGNDYKPYVQKYTGADFLPEDYLDTTNKTFSRKEWTSQEEIELKPIKEFTKYEEFLLGKSSIVNYSKVAKIFEELVNLQKFFDKYIWCLNEDIKKENDKIEKANTEISTQNQKKATAQTKKSTASQTESQKIKEVNDSVKLYKQKTDSESSIYDPKYNYSMLSLIKNDRYQKIVQYMDDSLKESAWTSTGNHLSNSYITRFETIVNTFKKEEYQGLYNLKHDPSKADAGSKNTYYKDAYTDVNAFSSMNNTYKYIQNDNAIFYALDFLYRNAVRINLYNKAVTEAAESDKIIDAADTEIAKQNKIIDDAKKRIDELNAEITRITNKHHELLKQYEPLTTRYVKDINNYKQYIEVAKNVAGTGVGAVHKQFNDIRNNIDTLVADLKNICDGLVALEKSARNYNNAVAAWGTANDKYEREKGKDTFSSQNADDAKQMATEYDEEKIHQLWEFANNIYEKYKKFLEYLDSNSTFIFAKTGHVKDIDTCEKLLNAAKSNTAALTGDIVTASDADGVFLYKNASDELTLHFDECETAGELISKNYHRFLWPNKLPMPFLIYLDATYPIKEKNPPSEENTATNEAYEKMKSSYSTDTSTNGSSSGDGTEENTDDNFGYNYEGKLLTGSKNEPEGKKELEIGKDENGDDDPSGAVNDQKGGLNSVLGDIGKVFENGLENAYILDYIFENFSYNTFVQDSIVKKEKLEPRFDSPQKVKSAFDSKTIYGKTQSNFDISKLHSNYYGAEIEYMLYGFEKADSNVLAAQASIFALRFGFDCIYAFTNSEVRNIARTAGLAVQAATCGIVPYQVVMIILQLAFAAAEAALDLMMINSGIDVVVVKTEETWMLSLSNVLDEAISAAAEGVGEMVGNGIKSISESVQDIIEDKTKDLETKTQELIDTMDEAAKQKVRDALDELCATAETSVYTALNSLMYEEYYNMQTKAEADVGSAINNAFGAVKQAINDFETDNDIADAVIAKAKPMILEKVDKLKSDVEEEVRNVEAPNLNSVIANKVSDFKESINNKMNEVITNCSGYINDAAKDAISDVSREIRGCINDHAKDLSEKASDAVSSGIEKAANTFVNGKLGGDGASTLGEGLNGSQKADKSLSSMIKFGYKEYLMLFMFIKLCANDDDVMVKMSNMIASNVKTYRNEFLVNKNNMEYNQTAKVLTDIMPTNYSLSNAYTYVNIHGEIKLNMLFLDLGFFQNVVNDKKKTNDGNTEDAENTDNDQSVSFGIQYNGLMGY